MKNVTITVDDAVLEWARVEAAKRNTSVSRMVGELLADKMRHDDAYERAHREWLADTTRFTSEGKYPTREEIYAERLDRFR
jgi:predicted transcriptional regulator